MKTHKQNPLKSITNKLVKFCLMLLFFGSTQLIKAQDIILLTNGQEISGKVNEITDTEIKYKSAENLTGPTYVILKSEVFLIKYENGTKSIFNENPQSTSTAQKVEMIRKPAPTPGDSDIFIPNKSKRFSGPRVGFTYISPGEITKELAKQGKNPYLTQFGWQFEQRVFTVENGGPTGLVEFVPLIAGMEQGMFLPSASFLMGIRGGGKNSAEFAVGPNVSVSGLGMVIAIGTNFHSKNINFPLNIAYVPSISRKDFIDDQDVVISTGHRVTLLIGFNVRKH